MAVEGLNGSLQEMMQGAFRALMPPEEDHIGVGTEKPMLGMMI